MRNLPPQRAKWLRIRIAMLTLALTAGAGAVMYRAWELQVVRADELREMAEAQYLREVELAPKRGTIYDRHGAELAVSVDVESVWANPRQLRKSGWSPAHATAMLGQVLELDTDRIRKRLQSDRYFVWIERHITPRLAEAVRALEIPGVMLTKEAKRYYPNRQLAAHMLGFANIDGVGIEGLELALEERLRGKTDRVPAIRDRKGHIVFSKQLLDDRASQGDDVYLTIDKTIQRVTERELELAVRTFEARAGSVVVMDPQNGEILAMANYPTFNPNEPGNAPAASRRNRAVTDRFEPGSTIKPFTVAGAMAVGAIRPEQMIDCEEGAMQVAEDVIHDSHAWEKLTPTEILKYSSNIGTAKIGLSLGKAGLFRILRRFGFGQRSGVPLPGETQGILRHYKRWYDMDAATISFGQGMSSTTLQLAAAMSGLANDGRLMKPLLVSRVRDARGQEVKKGVPVTRRQVVPEWASRLVTDMLTAVTEEGGTGVEAALDDHLVAGKTGTAQKADYTTGGYAEGKWIASFAGYVPARDPRLAIAVVIDEPMIAHYGGSVAAPVFRRIADASLKHLGVTSSAGNDALLAQTSEAARRKDGEPAAGRAANAAAEAELPEPDPGKARVPDLRGHTARSALRRAHGAGLDVSLDGTGVVVSQKPAAGNIVAEGSELHLLMAPPSHDFKPRPRARDGEEGMLASAEREKRESAR